MNNETIKVLIGDDTIENGIRLASSLKEKGLCVYTRKKDGNILFNSIIKECPDVVITDLSYNDSDAVVLMKEIRRTGREQPAFIVISDIYNSFIERQVIENGAAYFMSRPYDTDELEKIVRGVAHKKVSGRSNDIESVVTDVIRSLGVPAHIKGYHYLRCAILNSISNMHLISNMCARGW